VLLGFAARGQAAVATMEAVLRMPRVVDDRGWCALLAQAQPASGAFGTAPRNLGVGPAFWQFDMAISRLVSFGTRHAEVRLEAFNLFNHFNWGDPVLNFNSATFGKITTQEGDPRILQFGIKYDF